MVCSKAVGVKTVQTDMHTCPGGCWIHRQAGRKAEFQTAEVLAVRLLASRYSKGTRFVFL
jgi:NAD(P)H-hydrate repair Nnr-like enzyme with NAD(P)H-hydrate dehydratase domain